LKPTGTFLKNFCPETAKLGRCQFEFKKALTENMVESKEASLSTFVEEKKKQQRIHPSRGL
jgi:hypothetical protein